VHEIHVLEIEFQLEPADVEAWYLYQLDSVKAYRYQYWATAVIVSGVCAVSADRWAGSTVISATAAVAGFGVGWYGAYASLRSYFRAIAREHAKGGPSATEFGMHWLSLDASGISETGPAAQHKHDWKAVEGLSETSGHLFVLVAGGAAYIVPKRAFATEAEMAAFRSAFVEAIANRARQSR
jgi:hypothetical protein